jgi:hypothetical protein
MPQWDHSPQVEGATEREQGIVNRLHHLVDGASDIDPDVRPIVAEGMKLILELIEDRGRPIDIPGRTGARRERPRRHPFSERVRIDLASDNCHNLCQQMG